MRGETPTNDSFEQEDCECGCRTASGTSHSYPTTLSIVATMSRHTGIRVLVEDTRGAEQAAVRR